MLRYLAGAVQEQLSGIWATLGQGDHYLSILDIIKGGVSDMLAVLFQTIYALLWTVANLNSISDALFAVLKIVAVLLALFFVLILARGIFKKVGLVVMPFEVAMGENGKNGSGKAISDLLTSELQRIQEIHKTEFEEITITAENLSIPAITPKGESIEHGIPQMTSLGTGSSPLSVGIPLGQLIITIKRLCPGSEPVPVLSGSLQMYGRTIALTASLEDRKVRAWEIRRKIRRDWQIPEEHVPSMVRDLAYKISHTLAIENSLGEIQAKSWVGLKHFTEARDCYRSYTITGNLRDLQRSRNCCIKAMRSEKNYIKAADLLSALGSIYIDKNKFNDAEEIFRVTSAIRPESSAFGKGVVNWHSSNFQEALNNFDEVLRINPKSAEALVNKGAALDKLGRNEEAIKAYDEALNIDPKDAAALNNKGAALDKLGRNEEAIKAYDEALNINPKYATALNNKGIALGKLGRNEEAIKACDEALNIDPKYAAALYNKGNALGKLGRNEEAVKAYDEALNIDPKDAIAWNGRGWLLFKLGRYEDSLEASEKSVTIDPKSAYAWDTKGAALSGMEKYEDAIGCFDKSIEFNPQLVETWFHKAEALKALGRSAEAEAAFSKAKELGYKENSENKK